MKEIKIDGGFSASIIGKNITIDVIADNSTFKDQNMLRAELDIPDSSDKWEGIQIKAPSLKSIDSGAIAVSFELIYKWRLGYGDSWEVDTRRGKRLMDIDAIKGFAGFLSKSFEEYTAENNIDLSKPDRPARTGAGQQFYAELVSGEVIADAYFLGDSEGLGYGDNDPLGFYGKKQVTLYIKDSNKIDLSDISVNLYTGAPGSAYTGNVWFGEWTVKNENLSAFPPEFIIEKPATPRPFVVGEVTVSPVDKELISVAVEALGYIKGAADAGVILYGVQNYPYSKGGTGYKDGPLDTSDLFDMMGTVPAVFGLDSLSLAGMENAFRMPGIDLTGEVSNPQNIPLFIKGSALRSIEAWKDGAISTLSLHMSDPAMVYDDYMKDNKNRATGVAIHTEGEKYPWNFYGYNYGNSTRTAIDNRDNRERSPHKPMLRIYRAVTGQSNDAHDVGVLDVFNAYLDICADYCLLLQEQNIPVLFRPFHENSGDWFWWGNSGCEDENDKYFPEIFKRNWRHIVEYMYKRGVHNCIYVYSSNGSDFDNEEKINTSSFRPYEITYPGDEWVDICAFDDYTTDEAVMRDDIVTVANFAAKHGKIAAASEITGSPTDPAITEYLFRSLTDTAHLPVNIAYILQWTPPGFSPFLVSPTRANSSAANTLIRALNSKKAILANETNGFKPAKVNVMRI